MTNSSQPDESPEDYSYDLVHEDVEHAHGEPGRPARSAPVSMPQAPTELNGDYSYDMAHDIPAQDA